MRAVALYNPSDTICDFNVSFETLELGGKVKVRDVIKCRDLEDMTDSIQVSLPPHSVAIWKLEAEKRLEPVSYEAEWLIYPAMTTWAKIPNRFSTQPLLIVPAK